jgi:phosphate transport system substrate-binding protein
MTDEQLAQAKVPILHFPTVLGAVVPTYNVEGLDQRLRFSPAVLAGIYQGTITRWNDPALVGDNPGVSLPAKPIVPIHRSDGSGTTYVFTDYLTKVDAEWAKRVGRGTSVGWPVGLGGKGNEGVAGLVRQTPYSIGYVELVYALQTKLAYGAVRNRAGSFVEATMASVTAAAATTMPADFRVSVTDAAAPAAYPIASFTWLLVPSRIADETKGGAIRQFLAWMLGDGQGFAAALGYAPLPPAVIDLERKAVQTLQVGG